MIRSVHVNRNHPLSSGVVDLVRVSLSCEPWEKADPIVDKPKPVVVKDPISAVLSAVQSGNERFVDITTNAFRSQSGSAQKKARAALNLLRERGVLSCEQQPGKASKWQVVKNS